MTFNCKRESFADNGLGKRFPCNGTFDGSLCVPLEGLVFSALRRKPARHGTRPPARKRGLAKPRSNPIYKTAQLCLVLNRFYLSFPLRERQKVARSGSGKFVLWDVLGARGRGPEVGAEQPG